MEIFQTVKRNQFREVFQPSRIVLGILVDKVSQKVNVITLCFNMHCSYKPPMMAFSIHKRAYSYALLENAEECVLAVPGEALAQETLYCGTESGRDKDKVRECNIKLVESQTVAVPGLANAIANIELRITNRFPTGDHMTAIGEVLRFSVDERNEERCLISVGPREEGYEVLAKQGIHRIAAVCRHIVKPL